ncbi:synapsin isoform X1 [Lepeophtheirus salmonis]|nr:synapsin-like isoform X3 [Lepeophtheirus salmonis]
MSKGSTTGGGGVPLPKGPGSKTISAPTSPLKEKKAGFFGKVTSFSQVVSAKVEQARDAAGNIRVPGMAREKSYTLLVIDDANTDWSKYFRGRRIRGEYDIRVEQGEFKEISVSAETNSGVNASFAGAKGVRTFKPDFLLVRQNIRDANEDFRNIIIALQYGGIPSINSLESIYNFQDRPWIFSNMIQIQRQLGKENFPLINQVFYPNHTDMNSTDQYPCVLKVGHAHNGVGKVRIDNASGFQEMAGLVSVANSYCSVECFIDAKYDLHVQKIGNSYKAFMRKSLGGNWKTNVGQSILEETPILDKHKTWIDAVSEMFNGLAVCSLEAVVGKDGKEHIIEINDSATLLMGESQEEDRRNIADLVFKSMEEKCLSKDEDEKTTAVPNKEDESSVVRPPSAASSTSAKPNKPLSRKTSTVGSSSFSTSSTNIPSGSGGTSSKPAAVTRAASMAATTKAPPAKPPRPPPAAITAASIDKPNVGPSSTAISGTNTPSSQRKRHDSQDSTDSSVASESSSVSGISSASSSAIKKAVPEGKKDEGSGAGPGGVAGEGGGPATTGPEGEDTMKNLRKTFAGIFGELS